MNYLKKDYIILAYTERRKVACKNCGRVIDVTCISRHEKACINGYKNPYNPDAYHLDHDDLFCKFCKKELRNKNALLQHEIRCPANPNRKDYNKLGEYSRTNYKGQTKETNETIRKWSETVVKKYKEGYIHPCKGRSNPTPEHIYKEENIKEIKKWIDYVTNLNIVLPEYTIKESDTSYTIVSNIDYKRKDLVTEHRFVVSQYIDLQHNNCVHRLDEKYS